jgi:hypothetical protein
LALSNLEVRRKEKNSMKLLKGTVIKKFYGSGDSPSVNLTTTFMTSSFIGLRGGSVLKSLIKRGLTIPCTVC